MSKWDKAVITAWNEMIEWRKMKKFDPNNEEEIQSFLYYSFVTQMSSALLIKPKQTTAKPEKLYLNTDNKFIIGDMHYPDFSLGKGELVIELKFAIGDMKRKSLLFSKCKADIEKMKKHHPDKKRYFLLWDTDDEFCFIDQHQLDLLKEIDSECKILIYPTKLNESIWKSVGRKSAQTMKKKGVNFKELGTANAKKGMKDK